MFNPSTKMTNAERVAMFCKMIEENLPLENLCAALGASAEDLREFVKLNLPDLLPNFEETVVRSVTVPDTQSYVQKVLARRLKRHRLRRGAAAAPNQASPSADQKATKGERTLIDLAVGTDRFAYEGRPFDRLPEDGQEEVRKRAELFMDWRERTQ